MPNPTLIPQCVQAIAGNARVLPIPGYPDYYITDSGIVISTRRNKSKPMSLVPGITFGYGTVNLSRDGERQRTHLVHRLVLLTFVGEPPEGYEACHWNGVRMDNRVENLRWGTPRENAADRVRHGNVPKKKPRVEEIKISRFTKEQVMSAYKRAWDGEPLKQIASDYKVDLTLISHIKHGRRWQWLTGHGKTP